MGERYFTFCRTPAGGTGTDSPIECLRVSFVAKPRRASSNDLASEEPLSSRPQPNTNETAKTTMARRVIQSSLASPDSRVKRGQALIRFAEIACGGTSNRESTRERPTRLHRE